MSCGLPVISFEGDGPNSIITDGKDGFIIKNRDVEVFVDRVCQLIESQKLRQIMGQAAILSSRRFTAEKIIPMWKELFESLLRK
jgi:glycosyltransferase involved in cell wall biosynthesis